MVTFDYSFIICKLYTLKVSGIGSEVKEINFNISNTGNNGIV